MDSLNRLRELNNKLLESTNDEKYKVIATILEDDMCFFKMDIAVAFDILKSLGVENPQDVYNELISYKNLEKTRIKIVD